MDYRLKKRNEGSTLFAPTLQLVYASIPVLPDLHDPFGVGWQPVAAHEQNHTIESFLGWNFLLKK